MNTNIDTAELVAIHRIFPLISNTPGELLTSNVWYSYGTHFIEVTQQAPHKVIAVDFATQLWFNVSALPTRVTAVLNESRLGFWEALADMLENQRAVAEVLPTKPLDLQPFSESDWYIWAGADQPPDSQPLVDYDVQIAGFGIELSVATVVVDATGIEVHVYSQEMDNDTELFYELEMPWPACRQTAQRLQQPITPLLLKQNGFIKVA